MLSHRPAHSSVRSKRGASSSVTVPDAAGLDAARRVLDLASTAGPGDLVLFLLSGGASALLALPAPGIDLDDKQSVTRALLASGAAIDDDTLRHAVDHADRCRALLPEVFADHDVLLTPSAVGEAPVGLAATGDPLFGRMWTLLGTPAVAVPGLLGPAGLPLGVQVVAAPDADATALPAWLDEHLMNLPTAVGSAITDVTTDGGGVTVAFGPGPEPAIQIVEGRQVACHLHGVTVRDGGTHVGDPGG